MRRISCLVGMFMLALSGGAFGKDDLSYPSRPITMIIPWQPGGSSDLSMRAFGDAAAKYLGQPFVYLNRPGASGTLGPATMAANAKPDGYTVAQIPLGVMRLPLMQQTSWDAQNDFTYIIQLTGNTFGITTLADGQFKSWGDVVDYAKRNPGKVTYAAAGAGTGPHIGMERIAAKAGIKLMMVPYKGAAETNAAVLGGHTMLQAESTAWKSLVDSGRLRLLSIWTEQRSASWPNVPTLKELGYPFVFDSPFGLAGPKGMSPAVVAKLHDAFKKAFDDPAVVNTLQRLDMVSRYLNSADYTAYVQQIIAQEKEGLEVIGMLKKDK
jgi:tripartite-type tricarboxylate transporter receptor subunit TctC